MIRTVLNRIFRWRNTTKRGSTIHGIQKSNKMRHNTPETIQMQQKLMDVINKIQNASLNKNASPVIFIVDKNLLNAYKHSYKIQEKITLRLYGEQQGPIPKPSFQPDEDGYDENFDFVWFIPNKIRKKYGINEKVCVNSFIRPHSMNQTLYSKVWNGNYDIDDTDEISNELYIPGWVATLQN